MSKVRATGNESTGMKVQAALIKARIEGWEKHADLPGKPDFFFLDQSLAVFVDGRYCHGCPKHVRYPKKTQTTG